jgi:hypothetical protein
MVTLPAMPISEKSRSRLSISRRHEALTSCVQARCIRGSAVRNCPAVVLVAVSDCATPGSAHSEEGAINTSPVASQNPAHAPLVMKHNGSERGG